MNSPLIPQRKIIHVDMDAFYASVEQRDDPALRGRPVVVGGSPESRGVVCAASYEARKFGVRSAISCKKAFQLCPQAVFVRPHFEKYTLVSRQIREIFAQATPLVEPLSLDEAYLDVTSNLWNLEYARDVAIKIKDLIFEKTQLTASAGVGPNKFLAKIASDLRKPNGLVVIHPSQVEKFLENLPVGKISGVGPVTEKKLHEHGLRTAGQVRKKSREELEQKLGRLGLWIHDLSQGIDDRPVETEWEAKSRGTERTFEKDIRDPEYLISVVNEQVDELVQDLQNSRWHCRTLTLKIKYSDFRLITRSQTWIDPTDRPATLSRIADALLRRELLQCDDPIRLIGISLSHFVTEDDPIQLWFPFADEGLHLPSSF